MTIESIRDRVTITVPEAAALLHISDQTAYRAIERGDLPALRLGRKLLVPVPRLLALLEASDTPAA